MVKETTVEIKSNQKRFNVCAIEDFEEEKQNHGREVILLYYDPRQFSVNKMRNTSK